MGGNFSLALQQHRVDCRPVHRQRQCFAHPRIVEPRLKDQRQDADRRGGPDPAPSRQAAQFGRTQLHHIRTAEFEIVGLIAQRPAHHDFDVVQKRPPSGRILIGFVNRPPSRFPARNRESLGQKWRRVGRLRALPHRNPQGTAIVRPGRGLCRKRQTRENQKSSGHAARPLTHRNSP